MPAVNEFKHLKIPLAQLADNSSLIKSEKLLRFVNQVKEVYRLHRFYLVFLGTVRRYTVFVGNC
jgi:hypothetical protein